MGKKRISLSGDQKASLLWLVISIILLGILFFAKTQINALPDTRGFLFRFWFFIGFFSGIVGLLVLVCSTLSFIAFTFEKRAVEKAPLLKAEKLHHLSIYSKIALRASFESG